MNYTQAQIDRANAVSLEDFLRTQGETLIKSGREYRWKEHDSLTVRGNKWFRHSQSKGGYPIDFVMEFYGKSFPEAVQLLTGESGEGQTEATTAPPTAFHLPLHNRTADRAIQYLCESRGLNKTLVEAFLLSGDIYEDAKRHNVVFVGRDRSGTPRYAHVRGTADPFRQDIAGSDKSYPFHYEGNGNQLFVFEAPIDLLSFICLYPQDWQTRSYLALGGVSGKALDRFLSERKDTRKVFLCLDSDTAGSEACTRLAQSIPGEIAVIRLVPARKDWNDVLRQQGDIPSRKFIAETITLRELPTAQPVPMLRMADVELTSVDWLWFPYIPFGKLTIIQGNPGEGKTYDSQAPPRRNYVRQKTETQQFREDRQRCYRILSDYYYLLKKWENAYSPHTPEEEPHPLFVEAIQKKTYVEYLLDLFLYENEEEQKAWITEHTAEITHLERRLKIMAENKSTNRERLREITDGIEQGIKELFESEKYMRYLSVMSRFHRYSVNNTMLIYMQKPDATLVAGFNKWKNQFERHVKKGEHGITIIAPRPTKRKSRK